MAKVNTKKSIKEKTGSANKNFTITAGKRLSDNEANRVTGNAEAFKEEVILLTSQKHCPYSISIYKGGESYYIVLGDAYKDKIQEALTTTSNEKTFKQLNDANLPSLLGKLGNSDICKEKNNLYLLSKKSNVSLLICKPAKNSILEKTQGVLKKDKDSKKYSKNKFKNKNNDYYL